MDADRFSHIYLAYNAMFGCGYKNMQFSGVCMGLNLYIIFIHKWYECKAETENKVDLSETTLQRKPRVCVGGGGKFWFCDLPHHQVSDHERVGSVGQCLQAAVLCENAWVEVVDIENWF